MLVAGLSRETVKSCTAKEPEALESKGSYKIAASKLYTGHCPVTINGLICPLEDLNQQVPNNPSSLCPILRDEKNFLIFWIALN
jgi:hypothetical protein